MTPTSELASLLRLAAERDGEMFTYGTDGEHEIVMFKRPDVNMAIYLAELAEPSYLYLDEMDAIAEAVGMWFDVVWLVVPSTWTYHLYAKTGNTVVTHLESPQDNFMFGYESKRSASIAALCAILRYRYGEGK